MIRPIACLALLLSVAGPLTLLADTYRLRSGELLEGEPISFDGNGVVFRKPDGQFSTRAGWTNFTEAALKKLAEFPEAQRFTDEYIIEETQPEEEIAQLEIKPQEHPRLERLPAKGGFGALFRSPLSLTLILLIYLANIYAGFEIALFRNYPLWIGCVAAALLPFIGPIILICLPTRLETIPQPVYEAPPDQYYEETGEAHAYPADAPPAAAAAAPAPTAAAPAVTVYQRGTTTFNRRFFETKLANFMRVVPSEEDKDMVLHVKSARGDQVGSRITRVMPNELHLQVTKAGASADVVIPFTEIKEVKVCHKDAVQHT